MLEYSISVERVDATGSTAMVRQAVVPLDTSLAGRADAFNPAEMLLAALAACIIKSAERAAPMLGFDMRSMSVQLHAILADGMQLDAHAAPSARMPRPRSSPSITW